MKNKKNILIALIGGALLTFRNKISSKNKVSKINSKLSNKDILEFSKNLNVADSIKHIVENPNIKKEMLKVIDNVHTKEVLKQTLANASESLNFGLEPTLVLNNTNANNEQIKKTARNTLGLKMTPNQ